MKTISAKELNNLAMINGNENKYRIVVDNNIVKEWVGIGWIELHKATKEDKELYPTVLRT